MQTQTNEKIKNLSIIKKKKKKKMTKDLKISFKSYQKTTNRA